MNRLLPGVVGLAVFLPVLCAVRGAEPSVETASAEVSLVPFSHLDLFWGGTRGMPGPWQRDRCQGDPDSPPIAPVSLPAGR